MKTSRYDSQRADGTNKWDDCPWLKVCPSEATRGADGSRPPTSAAIGGRDPGTRAATVGGEFPQTGSRVSANGLDPRDSRTAERPALADRPRLSPRSAHDLAERALGLRTWSGLGRSCPASTATGLGLISAGPARKPKRDDRAPRSAPGRRLGGLIGSGAGGPREREPAPCAPCSRKDAR